MPLLCIHGRCEAGFAVRAVENVRTHRSQSHCPSSRIPLTCKHPLRNSTCYTRACDFPCTNARVQPTKVLLRGAEQRVQHGMRLLAQRKSTGTLRPTVVFPVRYVYLCHRHADMRWCHAALPLVV